LWYGILGLVAVASLYVRFRHAGGVERQQIKWLAYAASLVVLSTSLAYGVYGATGARWTWQAGIILLAIGLVGTPIAVGIAISKYRLYEIGILINRTLVYGALTAALALLYLGGVVTTQAIFQALTGQVEQPQLAIVVSTLVIAALFTP
jgi:cytochrome b subunit of formate dehydrogenase